MWELYIFWYGLHKPVLLGNAIVPENTRCFLLLPPAARRRKRSAEDVPWLTSFQAHRTAMNHATSRARARASVCVITQQPTEPLYQVLATKLNWVFMVCKTGDKIDKSAFCIVVSVNTAYRLVKSHSLRRVVWGIMKAKHLRRFGNCLKPRSMPKVVYECAQLKTRFFLKCLDAFRT
jgi:hypothetical protein